MSALRLLLYILMSRGCVIVQSSMSSDTGSLGGWQDHQHLRITVVMVIMGMVVIIVTSTLIIGIMTISDYTLPSALQGPTEWESRHL